MTARPGASAGPVGIQPEKVGCRDAAVAAPNASDLAPARRCGPRGHGFSAWQGWFSTPSSRRSQPEDAGTEALVCAVPGGVSLPCCAA